MDTRVKPTTAEPEVKVDTSTEEEAHSEDGNESDGDAYDMVGPAATRRRMSELNGESDSESDNEDDQSDEEPLIISHGQESNIRVAVELAFNEMTVYGVQWIAKHTGCQLIAEGRGWSAL